MILYFLFFFSSLLSYGQDQTNPKKDTTGEPIKIAYKPVIGIGRGVLSFYGEVQNTYNKNFFVGRTSTILSVSRKLNASIDLNLFTMHGTLCGNEQSLINHLNFQTDIWNSGAFIKYDFSRFFPKPQKLRPFCSIGIEAVEFNSKGDLKDADGNDYHFWSDGTIRNISEKTGEQQQSIILQRDYVYETDLRDLDPDNPGLYQQITLSIPAGIGFEMDIMNRLSMRMGATYHFTFTDHIDNISYHGEGQRSGRKGTDKFLITYFSFHYNLFPAQEKVQESIESYIDLSMLGDEDEDHDKVSDWIDQCPFTPSGEKVDIKGCPLDDDHDGVPNYLDKEAGTTKRYVNADGIGMTADELALLFVDSLAVRSEELATFSQSLTGFKSFKTEYLEIPERFKVFDMNHDDFISIDELLRAIDSYFDFNTDLTLEQVYELSDFFFDQ